MVTVLTKSDYQTLLFDIAAIYESSQKQFNKILVSAYWNIGRRIVTEEQNNDLRAEYGQRLLEKLSEDLSIKYGNGFSPTNLKYMRQFYQAYPIRQTSDELSWSHYQILATVKDKEERAQYERKAIKNNWSSRDLRSELSKDKVERFSLSLPNTQSFNAVRNTQNPVLSLTRGRLYTYRIDTTDGAPVIDCGFDVYLEGVVNSKPHYTNNAIIEFRKTADWYSIKESDAKKNELYTYQAVVRKIIDGDTLWVTIDAGFGIRLRQKLRLRSIDAPELTTTQGQKAKVFVEKILKDLPFVIIKTYKPDKFDRYLVDVFYLQGTSGSSLVAREGELLNQKLLEAGLAERWKE